MNHMRPAWSGFQFPLELPFESVCGRLDQGSQADVNVEIGLTSGTSASLKITIDVTGMSRLQPTCVDVGLKRMRSASMHAEIGATRFRLHPIIVDAGLTVAFGSAFPVEPPFEFKDSPYHLSVCVDVTGRTWLSPTNIEIGVSDSRLADLLMVIGVLSDTKEVLLVLDVGVPRQLLVPLEFIFEFISESYAGFTLLGRRLSFAEHGLRLVFTEEFRGFLEQGLRFIFTEKPRRIKFEGVMPMVVKKGEKLYIDILADKDLDPNATATWGLIRNDGQTVLQDQPGVVAGRMVSALIDATTLDPGTYFVRYVVNTGDEIYKPIVTVNVKK